MGLFWKDPNEKKEIEEVKTKYTKPSASTTSIKPASIPASAEIDSAVNIQTGTNAAGIVKEEYKKYFDKVFTDNNIPGPDYQEFVMALDSMKSLAIDEKTKFLTNFASFKAQGVTTKQLLNTAQKYIDLFGQKMQGFEQNADAQIADRNKQSQILLENNKKIEQQMQELNKQKIANEELSKKTLGEIGQINQQKNDFEMTYNERVKEIQHNMELISTYLGESTAVK